MPTNGTRRVAPSPVMTSRRRKAAASVAPCRGGHLWVWHGYTTTPRSGMWERKAPPRSMRPLRRQDSGLSLGNASRCGSEQAIRGVAMPEQSSSSNTTVTIHSCIRPNRDPKERRLCRAEESTPRRWSTDASASSAGLSGRKPR
jgi:hypothetical protein